MPSTDMETEPSSPSASGEGRMSRQVDGGPISPDEFQEGSDGGRQTTVSRGAGTRRPRRRRQMLWLLRDGGSLCQENKSLGYKGSAHASTAERWNQGRVTTTGWSECHQNWTCGGDRRPSGCDGCNQGLRNWRKFVQQRSTKLCGDQHRLRGAEYPIR